MSTKTEWSRDGGWRDSLKRKLSNALFGRDVASTLARHERALETVHKQLAEIAETSAQQKAEIAAASAQQHGAQDLEPLLAWIRGAETHLGALQAAHDRLVESHRRQAAQLDRVTARTAGLHARITDLQRVDTEIALTIARRRNSEQWR
jgi:cell division protein FtsB